MARFIIILLILIIALSYFGISIRHIVESPTGQDNFSFVWAFIQNGWNIITLWIARMLQALQHAFAA
jgi:hypothetical protein